MALAQWSDSLSVHIEQFDNEHKQLIDIINKLYEDSSHGKATDAISCSINELLDYSNVHFKNEEEFLKAHDSENLAAQQEQHSAFIAKINEFQKRHNEGTMTSAISMFAFLSSWLINHIQKVDTLYAPKSAKSK